jgi:hypothetical protein
MVDEAIWKPGAGRPAGFSGHVQLGKSANEAWKRRAGSWPLSTAKSPNTRLRRKLCSNKSQIHGKADKPLDNGAGNYQRWHHRLEKDSAIQHGRASGMGEAGLKGETPTQANGIHWRWRP